MDSRQQPPRFKYPSALPLPDHAKHNQTTLPAPRYPAEFPDPGQIPSFSSPDPHRPPKPTSRLHFSRIATGHPPRSPSGALGSITSLPSCATLSNATIPSSAASRCRRYSCSVAFSRLRSIDQTHLYQPSARWIYQCLVSRRYLSYSLVAIIPFHSAWTEPSWCVTRVREPNPSSDPDVSESQTKHAYRTAAGRRVQQTWRLLPVANISFFPRQPCPNPRRMHSPFPHVLHLTLPRRHWSR